MTVVDSDGNNDAVGKELYWRFAMLERQFKNNIDQELTRCFGENWVNDICKPDKSKIQLSLADVDMLEYYSMDEVQFVGIINNLEVTDEYYRSKGMKSKLSLGFWIKIIENWASIECIHSQDFTNGIISPELKFIFPGIPKITPPPEKIPKEYLQYWHITHIEEISDENKNSSGFLYGKYKIELLNTMSIIYTEICQDLTEIQSFRNDFCHFRFDIEKLKETSELLDKYLNFLGKPLNV